MSMYLLIALINLLVGSLAKVIKENKESGKKISEDLIRKWIIQGLLGLQFLHQNGIVHCNLRPENLLIDQKGNLRITDYGFSEFIPTDTENARIEHVQYTSPEIIRDRNQQFPCSDVWSLGCIAYELCNLKVNKIFNIHFLIASIYWEFNT